MTDVQQGSRRGARDHLNEMGLRLRLDDYSAQITSLTEPLVFVRVIPDDAHPEGVTVTDLNHDGWTSGQEAAVITMGVMTIALPRLSRIAFRTPGRVRRTPAPSAVEEIAHLTGVLNIVANTLGCPPSGPARHDGKSLVLDIAPLFAKKD